MQLTYIKNGLKTLYEAWHFVIDIDLHNSINKTIFNNIAFRELTVEDLDDIDISFPKTDTKELKGMLKDSNEHPGVNHFISMYENNKIVAYARFNKKFAGSRPFAIVDLKYFDTFISQLIKMRDQTKNYIRITFDDNDELANLCKKRNYTVHHHLFKMVM